MAQFVDIQAKEGELKRKRKTKVPNDPTIQSNYFMATWFDVDHPPSAGDFQDANKPINFMVYQLEKCPTTGRLHFQCYFEFIGKPRLVALIKKFKGCHWSCRLGTAQQAIDYCTKLETRQAPPVTFGTPKYDVQQIAEYNQTRPANSPAIETGKKKVSPLAVTLNEAIKKKLCIQDIARFNPEVYVRHAGGIAKLMTAISPQRNFKTDVIVFYGCPGCGKSRTARKLAAEHYKPDELYTYSKIDPAPGKEWWDGYDRHPCVIIDEMDGNTFVWDRILNIFDRYAVIIPVKGGSTHLVAETIFITCNTRPSDWYAGKHEFHALRRRIHQCYKFVCIKGARDENGDPVFEPQLDESQMRDPNDEEYNKWMEHINEQSGFLGKSLAPDLIFASPTPILDAPQDSETDSWCDTDACYFDSSVLD